MGTFHNDKGELHGITVVVDTNGSRIYVGRCDTVAPQGVVLLDADMHDESDAAADGVSKVAWLEKASMFGVFPRIKQVIVPTADVASVKRLIDV